MYQLVARGSSLFLCVLFWAAPATRAQSSPQAQFEDLARRAQAALDSRPEESAKLYKEALAIRPEWAEGWLYLGGALYQLNRFAEATDALRKGLELAPGIGNAWALLGLTEVQLEDQDQALADIRKGESLGLGPLRLADAAGGDMDKARRTTELSESNPI